MSPCVLVGLVIGIVVDAAAVGDTTKKVLKLIEAGAQMGRESSSCAPRVEYRYSVPQEGYGVGALLINKDIQD